jgi:flagellar basal body-associated protein FliL
MSDHNASELADIYIKMRERIRELEDKVKTIKEQQAMVADKMLELCNEQDANSLTTTNGTISRRLNSSYWTSDWDSFYNFVKVQ